MYAVKTDAPGNWRQLEGAAPPAFTFEECEQLEQIRWGTATAAFQVEGGAHQGGRSDSVWDVFARLPGAIHRGENAEHTCGFYEGCWGDALKRLQWLDIADYRFSVSWSRVVPARDGAVNQEGLEYYLRIVDDLQEVGIHPIVTLYHWDLPQWLEDEGGWLAPRAVDEFCRFVEIVCSAMSGRHISWITLNEPFCTAFHGYYTGLHAPGKHRDPQWLDVAITLIDAHLAALATIRRVDPGGEVGIAINLSDVCLHSQADENAGRVIDLVENRLFMDPLLSGTLPEDAVDIFGADRWERALARLAHDLNSHRMDFIGVNYYEQHIVARAQKDQQPIIADAVKMNRIGLRSANGVAVAPDGLGRVLERVSDRTRLPIWITEIGIGLHDRIDDNGTCNDFERIYFFAENLRMVAQSRMSGINIARVILWTLQDNFEWSDGYGLNYGLFHTDFASQVCRPKASAFWVKEMITSSGGGAPTGCGNGTRRANTER